MNPKLSLVIGILCISFAPILVLMAHVPPVSAAFYRMLIALLCLVPYCIIKGKLRIGKKELMIALAGGIIFGADIAVWNISLTKTSATVSTLIANLSPVWVGLLSLILFRKLSGILFWIGTAIAISGIIILAGYQNMMELKLNEGILLALFSSFLYAVYILLTKSVIDKVDTLAFVFYNLLGACLFSFLFCLYQQNNLIHFSITTWLCFIGLGAMCQLVGWLTITHSLRFLPSTKVSLALLSRAVIASCWSVLLLHEALGLKEVIGSLVILIGIGITFLEQAKPYKDKLA